MWIWILLAVLMSFWGFVAVAACRISSQISRMEDADAQIDATVRELLKDVEIDLRPAHS